MSGPVLAFPGLSSLTQTVPSITGQTLRRTDNSVGGVLGFEAAIDLSVTLRSCPASGPLCSPTGARACS